MIGANSAAHTVARMDATTTRVVDTRETIVMIKCSLFCGVMQE